MEKREFQSVVDAALHGMEEDGASANQLKVYRQTGFGAIRRHFLAHQQSDFSAEAVDSFVLQMRDDWENGIVPYGKWCLVRRGGELLKHFYAQGKLGLPPCAKWGVTHDRIRIEPSAHELADKNNIYALVWNTKQELSHSDYSASTLRHFQNEGFDRILRYCVAKGQSDYSTELMEEIVEQAENACTVKKTALKALYALHRASDLLKEFYETGMLRSLHVRRFEVRDDLDALDDPNMREIMELALKKMESNGAKPKVLKKYRTTGFGGIVRYCEELAQPQYSEENIDAFVKQTWVKFKAGRVSADT
jgi:hypothetical protein